MESYEIEVKCEIRTFNSNSHFANLFFWIERMLKKQITLNIHIKNNCFRIFEFFFHFQFWLDRSIELFEIDFSK